MKKLFLLIYIFLSLYTYGYAQTWLWAKGATGSGGGNITTDAFGHVYTSGAFSSPTITFGGITLTNAGIDSTEDVFLVKYDTAGNVIWAKSAGGNNSDAGTSVTTDAAGNVYIIGAYTSHTIIFGTNTLTHSASGIYNDMFVVKYDSSGNVLWAQTVGSSTASGDIDALSAMIDATGNLYVAGDFASYAAVFGAITLVDSGGNDMFLVKYSPSGNVIWAKAAQAGLYNVWAAIDTMNNIYVTGSYGSSISFEGTSLTGLGGYNIFLAKYDTAGNVLWAKNATTANNQYANAIATDLTGNVYVTGIFNGASLTFDTITVVNTGSPGSDYQSCIAKYNSSGNVMWAKKAVGSGNFNDFNSITTDGWGNLYMGGAYDGPTGIFDNDTLHNPNPANYAIFATKYDSLGNNLWAISSNGYAIAGNHCIAVNASGQIYLTGVFISPTFSIGATILTGGAGDQYFLARLDSAYNVSAGVPMIVGSNKNINIYPNPNDGRMTVAFYAEGYNKLEVYDCLGNKVYSTVLTGTEKNVAMDMHALPDGIYTVKVTEPSGLGMTNRFVKQ